MATTFRNDMRAGIKTVIDGVKAANPTLIFHTYDYPPESFHTPCVYIEKAVPETITHSQQIRFRVPLMNVVMVNKLVSNDQATDEQDDLVDLMIEAFTTNHSAAGTSTLIEPVRVVHDTEITDANGTKYAAAILTIQGQIQEGRA